MGVTVRYMTNTTTAAAENSCTAHLREQAGLIAARNALEASMASRLGISVPTLRLFIEASVKHPGLRWVVR